MSMVGFVNDVYLLNEADPAVDAVGSVCLPALFMGRLYSGYPKRSEQVLR
jgi:hypothetical protein